MATGILVFSIAVGVSSCGFSHPDNRPRPVAGQRNGELPASLLTTVDANCRAEVHAGDDLRRLLVAARRDGIVLTPGQCYRDYANQRYWRTYWCNLGQCQKAAVPGTSNHGWGKAIDFKDLAFGTAAYRWLQANAWQYGWNHPGWADRGQPAAEAWHWEWVGDGGTMFAGTMFSGPSGVSGAEVPSDGEPVHDEGPEIVDQ